MQSSVLAQVNTSKRPQNSMHSPGADVVSQVTRVSLVDVKAWPGSVAGNEELRWKSHDELTACHPAALPAGGADADEALCYLLNVMCLRTARATLKQPLLVQPSS